MTKKSDVCDNLQSCIDRWSLIAPFRDSEDNDAWGRYYAVRRSLEFRHENLWDEKGEELQCHKGTFDSHKRRKVTEVPSHFIKPTPALEEAWRKLLEDEPILKALYKGNGIPNMHPHCRESYVAYSETDDTTKEQYEMFLTSIRSRVEKTLKKSKIPSEIAVQTAKSVYMLQYWVNFEDEDIVRTSEFATRIYSNIGNGECIDFTWYFHYRVRMTIAPEKYSQLCYCPRDLLSPQSEVSPQEPTFFAGHREMNDSLATLDGDSDKHKVRKVFIRQDRLKRMSETLFGGAKISPYKVFGVAARASGAYAAGEQAGWLYVGMRNRYKLLDGEESDEEEKGDADGPGCAIM